MEGVVENSKREIKEIVTEDIDPVKKSYWLEK